MIKLISIGKKTLSILMSDDVIDIDDVTDQTLQMFQKLSKYFEVLQMCWNFTDAL
jgi:hypothetical protein